ncbi:MAG: hypothetical protein JSU96_09520 [Acidobacteriota bacterium]|nr:MAG: hypothetical protein JSU96_09520 [Acidobacteriota bacterium]
MCWASDGGLVERVTGYWEATISRNKVAALQFVLPSSHNVYLHLPELWFRDWKLQSVEPKSDGKSLVRISTQVTLPQFQQTFAAEVVQHWVLEGDVWYLTVPSIASSQVSRLLSGSVSSRGDTRGVSVLPETLVLHFLNPVQRGSFIVLNGDEGTVEITRVELLGDDLRIVDYPSVLQPGMEGRITVEFTGSSEEKELNGVVRVTTVSQGKIATIERSVLYNHIGPETRAFFGLTEEEARLLPRGAQPQPVVKPVLPPANP